MKAERSRYSGSCVLSPAPWFDLVLNYFSPQLKFEEVSTYWECGCAAVNAEVGDSDFSVSEGLGR